MEHRWGRRIACGAAVHLVSGDGAPVPGRLRDVSMSGAFVETTRAPALLTPVEVIMLRDQGAPIRRHGNVVRWEPAGVGIEWREASPGAICPVLGCATPCRAATNWD